MLNVCPFDGSGTLPCEPSTSKVPFCGRQPLKVGPERLSTSATLVTQVVPARQSPLVEHISLQMPSWQDPRSQSLSAVQALPSALDPRFAMQMGMICDVGVGLVVPTGLM